MLHASIVWMAGVAFVVIRGCRSGVTSVTVLADWKNAFVAAVSWCSLNIKRPESRISVSRDTTLRR
jgi:hypothetical protein